MTGKDEKKDNEEVNEVVEGAIPVRTVKLTSEFCAKKQLGKAVDFVNYIDTSTGVEENVRLQLDIETFSATRKADLSAIAQDRFPKDPLMVQTFETELVVAEALGIDHVDVLNLKSNKPSGVWDSIVFLVNQRLGAFGGLTKQGVEAEKNSESQE